MQFLRIVLLCILASCIYGVIHDQITARICVEYFTIGHPKIIESESPTLLAFAWGIRATAWMGGILGILIALAARAGNKSQLTDRNLIRPIAILLGAMAVSAIAFGVIGRMLATNKSVWLVSPLAEEIPPEKHINFLTDLWAHSASYGAATLGGIILIAYIIIRRIRVSRAAV